MKESRERNPERPSFKPSDLLQCPFLPFPSTYLSLRSPFPSIPAPRGSDSSLSLYFLLDSCLLSHTLITLPYQPFYHHFIRDSLRCTCVADVDKKFTLYSI